jgi:hypothetical protein
LSDVQKSGKTLRKFVWNSEGLKTKIEMPARFLALVSILTCAMTAGFSAEQSSDSGWRWTCWVSGGHKGIAPRACKDELLTAGVSEGYINERAVDFTPNGCIAFLRSGKDIENPEFTDPAMKEIGSFDDHKLWKAEYYRDLEARKNVKALMLLLESDEGLRPFFFVAVKPEEKLTTKVEPNSEETERVSVSLKSAKGKPRGFTFAFSKGIPELMTKAEHW